MKFSLQGNGRYSPAERELFALLPVAPKAVSSAELAERRLKALAAVSVGPTLRSLARKVLANEKGFRVARSRRSGPNPTTWWIERSS